jgi:hypothetical protein
VLSDSAFCSNVYKGNEWISFMDGITKYKSSKLLWGNTLQFGLDGVGQNDGMETSELQSACVGSQHVQGTFRSQRRVEITYRP